MLFVCITFQHVTTDRSIRHAFLGVEHTYFEQNAEQTLERSVDVAFAVQALAHTFSELLVEVAALKVSSGKECIAHGRGGIGVSFMMVVEVVHCATVGSYIALEVPLIAKDVHHKRVVAAAWLSVEAIIGTHHAVNACFYDKFVESRQISVPKVESRWPRIKDVTAIFGATMHGKVLGTCHRFQVIWVVAFETAHYSRTHLGGKIWVFAVGFLTASPARVAKDIDIRSPISKATILSYTFSGFESLVE